MISDNINMALEQMKLDINNTMIDFDGEDILNLLKSDNPWRYYISVHAKNEQSLIYASKLLMNLKIKARSILLVTESYKTCSFDCINVADAFRCIRALLVPNVESVSVMECTSLYDGDFYISIIKKNVNTGMNDIMTYRSLKTIIEDK